MLATHDELDYFERSQLGLWRLYGPPRWLVADYNTGSLCCESAEEAKTLIPSLANKISDADLQELLDEITKLRNFVE